MVDIFHIGPQKAATTWVYECLEEHPEVNTPHSDTIHYYDIFYAKGYDWYMSNFEDRKGVKIDPTTTYIRSPWAPRRIAEDNPDAKIICCLRNPIDRAFSHYWHEKKKRKISFDFGEVTQNYDLFSSWIEPGFYAEHLGRYLEYFQRDQIRCLLFDQLKKDDEEFLRQVLEFMDVDPTFRPSWIGQKANEAGGRRTFANTVWRKVRSRLQKFGQEGLVDAIENSSIIGPWVRDRDEYEQGLDQEVRCKLQEICEPEIQRTEALLDLDLSHWRASS
jgi:hypothetical protein